MDPRLAKACSDVLETDILVWKYMDREWEFFGRIRPFKRSVKTPLALLLKDHSTTISVVCTMRIPNR